MDYQMDVDANDLTLAPVELTKLFNVSLQAITKQIKKLDVPTVMIKNRNFLMPEGTRKLLEERGYHYPNKVVSFQIVKGGAGKSSLSYNLAVRANQLGARVLCIDIDQQANFTQALLMDRTNPNEEQSFFSMIDIVEGVKKLDEAIIKISNTLHLLPSNMNNSILDQYMSLHNIPLDKIFKKMIEGIRKNYDLIIFDCPPAINKPNIAAALASDEVIMPVNPDRFTIEGLKYTIEGVNDINKNFDTNVRLRIVYNKFHPTKRGAKEILAQLYAVESYKNMMYNTIIPEATEVTNAINQKTSIFHTNRKSGIREDLDNFAKEVLGIDEFFNNGKIQ